MNVGYSLFMPLPYATSQRECTNCQINFLILFLPTKRASFLLRDKANLDTKVTQERDCEERQREEDALLKEVVGNCDLKCSRLAGRVLEGELEDARGF